MKIYTEGSGVFGSNIRTRWYQKRSGKYRAINEWPRPKKPDRIKRILGNRAVFSKIYQNMFRNYLAIDRSDDKNYGIKDWSEKCETAFEELKIALTTTPILMAPNWSRPFSLPVGASEFATGATLKQGDEKGRR